MNNLRTVMVVCIALLICALELQESKATQEFVKVKGAGFVGTFAPSQGQPTIGLLVLGGAEGGMPEWQLKEISELGYPTLAVAYFKAKGLPQMLDEVPVEPIDKAVRWLSNRPEVLDDRVVIIGASKGAELALLVASSNKQVTGVVAFAPSNVVFQGIPKVFWPPRSSWTRDGKALPFVPYRMPKEFNYASPDLHALYNESLRDSAAVKLATIPVEKIHGPILLFSGRDDRMWPSSKMADEIIARLKQKAFLYNNEHVAYDNAGHVFAPLPDAVRNQLGGTEEGNLKALNDSHGRLVTFLKKVAN